MKKGKPQAASIVRTFRLQKQIVPFGEEGSPENEPLFVNHFQISHQRMDAFIDVGIIPLDDILNLGVSPPTEATARFLVLNRLAMSLESLAALRDQINEILEAAESAGFYVQSQTGSSTAIRDQTVSASGLQPWKERGQK